MTELLIALTLLAAPRVVGPAHEEATERGATEVIVLLQPGATVDEVLAANPQVLLLRRLGALPGFIARVTSSALTVLSHDVRVATVEADQLGHAQTEEAARLTGVRQVVRESGLTGRGVRFAVLDTGFERAHPDLDGGLLLEKCFVLGGCPPMNADTGDLAPEGSGHGTHVAGIITGDGRVAPRGVAPGAEFIGIRVFNQQSVGRVSDWVAALDWVLSNHEAQRIRLVNLSIGTDTPYPGACDAEQPALAAAVDALRDAGLTLFASAGNEAVANGMTAPACVSGVIAVGAVYDSDLGREPDTGTYSSGCFDADADAGSVACFSNSSAGLDLLAPGSRIRSSVPGRAAGERRGTSQASPHAAAIAALMLELDPLLTPDDVERILKATGTPKVDPKNRRETPLVNAPAALQQVRETQCARRAIGATCELPRACDASDGGLGSDGGSAVDAGPCVPATGVCAEAGCVVTLPVAQSQFPAEGCGCSARGGLVAVLVMVLLSRRRAARTS